MKTCVRTITWVMAVAVVLLLGTTVSARDLVVHVPSGSISEAVKVCYDPAFTKATGAKVVYTLGGSAAAAAKIRAQAGSPEIDVAYMDIHIAHQMKMEGLLEKMDFTKFSSYPDVVKSAFDPDGFTATHLITGTIIAYNPKVVVPAPTSWADFLDPKYRGKIALGDLQNTSGYHFLVAMARLQGGSEKNIDPGFKTLKELNPSVVAYYTQADQLVSLFERGDVVMAPWYPDRTGVAADKGVPVTVAIPKEGGIGILVTFSIPKGSKNKDLALKYIDIALSTEAEQCYCERQYSGSTNTKIKLSPKAASLVDFGKDLEKLYFPDFVYIAQHQAEWVERWRREIQK